MTDLAPPRKAFLLAAGLGTRMRPLSEQVPKALLPVHGRAAFDRLIDRLARWGVREFLVNLHHLPDPLLAHLKLRAMRENLRVALSYEPLLLDTGGALRRAAWFLDDEPFWLVNTDIVAARLRPEPFLRAWRARRPLAALWVTAARGPRTVETKRGCVTCFRSPRPGAPGTVTFCGLHLLTRRILDYLPRAECAFSIVRAYEEAMRRGERIAVVEPPQAAWLDIGSPETYLEAHRPILPPHPAGGESVVLEGATLGPRARLTRAIVGPGVRLNTALEGVAVDAAAWRAAGAPSDAEDRDRVAGAMKALRLDAPGAWVQPLPGRGSDRSFFRVGAGRRTAMVVVYGLARPENAKYAAITRFLRRRGVPVPAVLLDLPARRVLALADAGSLSLEAAARGLDERTLEQLYRRVLTAGLRLHAIAPESARSLPLEPPFGGPLYAWEHDLFARHFLEARLRLPRAEKDRALAALRTVSRRLVRLRPVLVHRDLQSSNILLPGGRPVFIDYQGLRPGPAAYDLASLLCDPYVALSPALRARLLEYYAARSPRGAEVRETFWCAAVQRLSQALGAYGRLAAAPATARFARHIPPALANLREALDHVEGMEEFRRVVDRARAALAP